jgi:hypothetical protein
VGFENPVEPGGSGGTRRFRCGSPRRDACESPRRNAVGLRPKMRPWASEEARLSVRKHSECPRTLGECPKALGECPKALGEYRKILGEHPEMFGGGFRCGLKNRSSSCTVCRAASPKGLSSFRASPVNTRGGPVKPSDRRHTTMPVRSLRVPVAGFLVRPLSFRGSSSVSGLYRVAQHVGHLELNQEAWLLSSQVILKTVASW